MSLSLVTIAIGATLAFAAAAAGAAIALVAARRRTAAEMQRLEEQIVAVSADAPLGRRIERATGRATAPLEDSINRLFDALVEKDDQIVERERLFRSFVHTLPEVAVVHDERILLANDSAGELLGMEPGQLEGKPVSDLIKPAYRTLFRQTTAKRLAGERAPRRVELQLIDGTDQGLWAETSSTAVEYRGKPAVLTIARDIGHRRSAGAAISEDASYTLESIGEGVVTTDTRGRIEYMNHAAERLTGHGREEVKGAPFGDIVRLVDEFDRRPLGDPVQRCLSLRQRVNMGRRALLVGRSAEHEHSVELSASPVRGAGRVVTGAVVLFHDVSEIRGHARQMSYQATHDALTGLVNRQEFERRLEEAIDIARAEHVNHVLCYLDLDRFKAVNDTSGHMAGDAVLREVASLVREQVRDSDTVARIGGDEFGLLLAGCPLEKARQLATDVCRAVAERDFVWRDRSFSIGVSIGLVEITASSGSLKDMLAAADSACYVAKQRGRGQVHVYSAQDEMLARERGEISWLRRLQQALRDDGFSLATQSIIAVAGGLERGPATEVLLRLGAAGAADSSPGDFILAAERYNLMPQIDRWVVKTTFAALAAGQIRLPEGRSCSINLSGQTLGDESFLEFVVECLDRSGIPPSDICFEVTEAALGANLKHAQRFIEVLHGMGCEFALDDFGRGLGAFSNLKHLPVDYLKIDGSFTRSLARDSVNQEMVSAMIKLARTMHFRTVAEEVEEQADFDLLRNLGVDYVQGYFVERPEMVGAGR